MDKFPNSEFDFSKNKGDVKVIGNFIYHDYGISKHPEYAPFIENNFEYVEILVKKVDEEEINQSKGNIKSIEEYREKFLNLYDSLHPILQQALPLLFQSLEYEINRLEEGESGVEEDNNRD